MPNQPHLLILGGGSAAMTGAIRALEHGATVTVANAGLPMGGTCLNVGCVPSKYFIRAAEWMHHAKHPTHPGLTAGTPPTLDWKTFMAGGQALVDELRRANYEEPIPKKEGLRWIEGQARLVVGDEGRPAMQVAGETIPGDYALIATGARSFTPPIEGLADTPFLTNEYVFSQPEQPKRMIVLGGGYIALECAQAFQRLGTEVTLLQRSGRILKHEPEDIALGLQEILRSEGIELVTDAGIQSVQYEAGEFAVATAHGTFRADQLFLGTGRVANTTGLPPEIVEPSGPVTVDEFQRTPLPRVYAAGDVTGGAEYVYTAAAEAEAAVDHMFTGTAPARDYHALPWVMFTDPQVAGVGMTLEAAKAAGLDCDAAELPMGRWPRFRVTFQTQGFLRLVRDRERNVLIGARALCPEAGELMSEIALCIRKQIPVTEIPKILHPYLTLSEGIERAVFKFTP